MRLSLPLWSLALLFQGAWGIFLSSLRPKVQTRQNNQLACDNSEPDIGVGYFTQSLNHSNPSQGTFKQKYFWRSTYWGGPGYPVILMTPGETAMAPYCDFLTGQTLLTQFAIAVHGAVVLIEHRYWGDSSPYDILTTETLQHLTLNNSVADLANFARNVKLPFDTNSSSNAPDAPWVLTGGSYAGALVAWTARLSLGTFWAYHASSAPVQAVYNFWQFFSPIMDGMPQNCSKSMAQITEYIDNFLETQGGNEVQKLKEAFGVGSLTNNADFASVSTISINTWQDSSLTSGYTQFFQMCDAIEGYGVNNTTQTTNGTKAEEKTLNLAWWFKHKFLPGWCFKSFNYSDFKDPMSAGCLDSYNLSSPLYTDRRVDNSVDLQWYWMLCNEPFGYWQTGEGPANATSIASKFLTTEYFQRQCGIYFGGNGSTAYGVKAGRKVEAVNNLTGGWNFRGKRMLWVNGEFDPWRPASVSSLDRPGGPLQSTTDAVVAVVKGGKHCEDLTLKEDTELSKLQVQEVAQTVTWVNEFYNTTSRHGKPKSSA